MRISVFIVLLVGMFCGCQYRRITIDRHYKFSFDDDIEAALHSPMEKWFDGSNVSSNFCIRAYLSEGFVCCYVINVSDQNLIVYRGSDDFSYALKYRDLRGDSDYAESPYSCGCTPAVFEILSPNPKNGISISPCSCFLYSFPIPKDCARILAASVAIEYATFPEIQKSQGVDDLYKIVKKNTIYVPVEFFDNAEDGPPTL